MRFNNFAFLLNGGQHANFDFERADAGRIPHFAIIAIIALIGFFVAIPMVSAYVFWIAIIAYVVLALGCVMKGA